MKSEQTFDCEKSIAQAAEQFKQIKEYVMGEAQSQSAYAVEKRLFKEAMKLSLYMMGAYFEKKRGGHMGQAIVLGDGQTLPRERLHDKQFVTVFGELMLKRWYYHEDGAPGFLPLDESVNLPERSFSYYVQELLSRDTTDITYDEVMAEMARIFGFAPYKHTVEAIVEDAACDVQSFYEIQPPVSSETEAEILVTAIDGKGVPMVKDEPAERKVRLARGEKLGHKKEATVSAVYTIQPYERTAEEIVSEVRDKKTLAKRPRPQNKRVRATLSGKQAMMQWVAQEAERRDPYHTKARVCLMDGSKGLWTQARAELKSFTFILDLFHALEYLWKVAYVFHGENSPEAEAFVRQRLLMLLEGKVGYVIGGMRQMLTKHRRLRKAQRDTTLKTIAYYESNRKAMRYDEYIAAGYPIGSGAVEAACRHLVKDRMEGSGMRWTVPGAEAVLQLRALYLNGDWNAYWQHHMQCEYARRYGSKAA